MGIISPHNNGIISPATKEKWHESTKHREVQQQSQTQLSAKYWQLLPAWEALAVSAPQLLCRGYSCAIERRWKADLWNFHSEKSQVLCCSRMQVCFTELVCADASCYNSYAFVQALGITGYTIFRTCWKLLAIWKFLHAREGFSLSWHAPDRCTCHPCISSLRLSCTQLWEVLFSQLTKKKNPKLMRDKYHVARAFLS